MGRVSPCWIPLTPPSTWRVGRGPPVPAVLVAQRQAHCIRPVSGERGSSGHLHSASRWHRPQAGHQHAGRGGIRGLGDFLRVRQEGAGHWLSARLFCVVASKPLVKLLERKRQQLPQGQLSVKGRLKGEGISSWLPTYRQENRILIRNAF